MVTILQGTDYPAVRAAIDASLDALTLPDSVIALPIYADLADQEIKRRVPLWATIIAATGDAAVQIRIAAVYLTASLIVGSLPSITREDTPDYTYRADVIAPAMKAEILRARAFQALNVALASFGAAPLPTFFTIALGTRVSGRHSYYNRNGSSRIGGAW